MRLPVRRYPLDLSVILPVYNEVESVPLLHDKLRAALQPLQLAYEIIYVDDGSTDGSVNALLDIQHADPAVVVALQRRNFGKSHALSVGWALARGAIIVTMDSDLQDEPAEIPQLLARIHEGYDVVTGWKQQRQDPLSKRIPSKIANGMTTLMTGVKLHDMNSGFKAYRADVVQRIRIYGDLHRYIPVLAHYAGYKVTEVPVVHHPRRFGRSKFGAGRFVRGGLDLMTVVFLNLYGRRPLHLFGGAGALLLVSGFIINLYLSIEWLNGVRPLSERPLLILGVLMMVMGVQLLTLGLLAELIVAFVQRSEDPLHTLRDVYRTEVDEPVRNEIDRTRQHQ